MSTTTLKFKYLHKVDGSANNNKFYKMQENSDGTFTATYGREGAKGAIETYSMSLWDKKLNEKLGPKKGYTDVTEHRTEETAPVKTVVKNSAGTNIISKDKHVNDIISALQSYANQQTATVYKAEAKGVTQKQIDDAQKNIDNLSYSFKNHFGKSGWSINLFNAELTKLYIIIPRKMKNVADYLITDKWTKKQIEDLIGQEQSNLDSMASQVIQQAAQVAADDDTTPAAVQQTLLDILGLDMELVTDQKTLDMVKKKAEEHAKRVLRVFAVTNRATQKEFDVQVRNAKDKKTDMMWHGSRRANWYFIIQQGLRIRPSGAVYSGSMFGDGIYFASECDKSMGYTDSGRWAGGRSTGSNRVYMALYEVHLGKQYCIKSSDSSLSAKKLETLGGYDSTWGQKGPNLYRNEYITYKSCQSTIKYLIEFQD